MDEMRPTLTRLVPTVEPEDTARLRQDLSVMMDAAESGDTDGWTSLLVRLAWDLCEMTGSDPRRVGKGVGSFHAVFGDELAEVKLLRDWCEKALEECVAYVAGHTTVEARIALLVARLETWLPHLCRPS